MFDSLVNKLDDYPELNKMLHSLLFTGKEIAYVIGIRPMDTALMFGFVKVSDGQVLIANRIFETLLYNYFLTAPTMQQDKIYDAALKKIIIYRRRTFEHGNDSEKICSAF